MLLISIYNLNDLGDITILLTRKLVRSTATECFLPSRDKVNEIWKSEWQKGGCKLPVRN